MTLSLDQIFEQKSPILNPQTIPFSEDVSCVSALCRAQTPRCVQNKTWACIQLRVECLNAQLNSFGCLVSAGSLYRSWEWVLCEDPSSPSKFLRVSLLSLGLVLVMLLGRLRALAAQVARRVSTWKLFLTCFSVLFAWTLCCLTSFMIDTRSMGWLI